MPETSENFRQLCTGEAQQNGAPLTYKNTSVTRAIPNQLIEAGGAEGSCLPTIYGKTMLKEATGVFDKRGLVAMTPADEHRVGSRFFITLGDFSHLDHQAVVVGEVVEGLNELFHISRVGDQNGNVKSRVFISNCGEEEVQHLEAPAHGHGHH